ncbi:HU family DNA-binding protein [Comamonas sp. B-9]|uniref:HU family DNA-binding protein n=1 Tax=Comamonas sp. B-9 TaxID=1055192 RepID=UPI00130DDD05|nr:HU family DNA-binding protein [Comamonas sp. B-9]
MRFFHPDKETTVNKSELIEHIADNAKLTKAEAGRALHAVTAAITDTLRSGHSLQIMGFGTFEVVRRAGRPGRNPRTGESVRIEESKAPKFRPGKELKAAVN